MNVVCVRWLHLVVQALVLFMLLASGRAAAAVVDCVSADVARASSGPAEDHVQKRGQAGGQKEKRGGTAKEERAARLKRWRSLDPETQAQLRKRFEKLEGLSPSERARLVERAARLDVRIERTLASLAKSERNAIEALPPRERRRVLRAIVADEARVSAARIRERLTPEERAELATASPEQRERLLRSLRDREFARVPERLARLARELGLSPSEFSPKDGERLTRGALAGAVRRRAKSFAQQHGLPATVSSDEWDALLQKPDRGFIRAYLRLRMRHPEFGIPPERWERQSKTRGEIAKQLVSLTIPTAAQRAETPRAPERVLRRRALLGRRAQAEDLIVRKLKLSTPLAVRIRTLDDDGFVALSRYAAKSLREGAEMESLLRRWFEKRTKASGRKGRKRGVNRPGDR